MNGFLDYDEVVASGEIAYRANANFVRLEGKKWRADTIHYGDLSGWPGDWEGRAILALTLLSQSTHRKAAFLDEIMEKLPSMLNESNYFGNPIDPDRIDEQQVSGNSWFLRAMCEYYEWKKDDFSLKIIKDIVQHLILPCKGRYKEYPLISSVRQRTGDMAGTLFDGVDGSWKLSSDTGCAFMMVDGASHAYAILRDPKLKEVLDEMIGKFLTADLLKDEFQTHATLSATRGIIRLYQTDGEEKYLDSAVRIYGLYRDFGMTENYANYNWFGRPDTWTEPCGIIDSFIVAMNLWDITGKTEYAADANNILTNALGHAQRPNGGFGCDECSGVRDVFIHSHGDAAQDAYWCCSMRGGEGLSRTISFLMYRKENVLSFPLYYSAEIAFVLDGKNIEISETDRRISEDIITFRFGKIDHDGELKLRFFVPDGIDTEKIVVELNGSQTDFIIEAGFVEFSLRPVSGDDIILKLPAVFQKIPVRTSGAYSGYFTFRHGGSILGVMTERELSSDEVLDGLAHAGRGKYVNERNGIVLEPINDLVTMSTDEVRKSRRQILFL